MPVWPAELPTAPQFGWSEAPGDGRVRTQTDAGPAKVRRRFSSTPSVFSVQFVMTQAQATRLLQFYENASDASPAGTGGGALSITGLPHPRDDSSATFRFLAPPVITQASTTVFRASLRLELLP